MAHTTRRVRTAGILLADLASFFIAWTAAFFVAGLVARAPGGQWFPLSSPGGTVFTAVALLVVLGLALNGHYSRRSAFWEETRVFWHYAFMAALGNLALNFLVQISYTRALHLLAWVFVIGMAPLTRLVARECLIRMGRWKRNALVVGDGVSAAEACRAIRGERNMGLQVAGLLGEAGSPAAAGLDPSVPIIDPSTDVEAAAYRCGASVILIALEEAPNTQSQSAAAVVSRLHDARFEVFVVPPLHGLPVQSMQAQSFFSNDVLLLRLRHNLLSPFARFGKRMIDIAAASALLVLVAPLMAWVAWRIRREDGGPIFYTQPRVGNHDRDFRFIKFRSMVQDADARLLAWKTTEPELYRRYEESNFKLPDDPRILKVGRWIRRTSVDELPQLWN
ncbi:MAG: sugar transferase, partial [Burkholderiaceae bacterium]